MSRFVENRSERKPLRIAALLTFLFASNVFALDCTIKDEAVARFLQFETVNDYQPASTLSEEFRPKPGVSYEVPYLSIPTKDLEIVDLQQGSKKNRAHFLETKKGESRFKFFIHPGSVHLYKPLIQKYGIQGYYCAVPTASTRTILAWNPSVEKSYVFMKLSLAQQQDNLGRIIPDWEVRRSVRISSLAQLDSLDDSIIPEFVGAYVRKSEGLGYVVDHKQGEVFQHGMIGRDASFLTQNPGMWVMPLFAFFTSGPNGEVPLIIQIWKQSGTADFHTFMNDFLFKPFFEKNKKLFFEQGIIPEFHGQNVVVIYDPKTKQIKKFKHRDIGSMKVDARLRLIRGRTLAPLRGADVATDFKYSRATEVLEWYTKAYFIDWIFTWTYRATLAKHVDNLSADTLKDLAIGTLRKVAKSALEITEVPGVKGALQKLLGLDENVQSMLEQFYRESEVPDFKALDIPQVSVNRDPFIRSQIAKKQFLSLPSSWQSSSGLKPGESVESENGIFYRDASGELLLVYLVGDGQQFSEVGVCSKRASGQK